jgi:hypothetical protein
MCGAYSLQPTACGLKVSCETKPTAGGVRGIATAVLSGATSGAVSEVIFWPVICVNADNFIVDRPDCR